MSPFVALFDSIGSSELLVVLLLVLIFFGGDKMPEFARGLAKIMREFRKAASGVEQEFKRAMEEEPPPPPRPSQITPTTPAILPPNPSGNAALPPPPTSSAQPQPPFQPYGIQADPNDVAPAVPATVGADSPTYPSEPAADPGIDADGIPRPVPPAPKPAPAPRPAGDVDAG